MFSQEYSKVCEAHAVRFGYVLGIEWCDRKSKEAEAVGATPRMVRTSKAIIFSRLWVPPQGMFICIARRGRTWVPGWRHA